MDLLFILTAKE